MADPSDDVHSPVFFFMEMQIYNKFIQLVVQG